MNKDIAVKLVRNKKIKISLVLGFILTLIMTFLISKWVSIISWLLFLLINFASATNKFESYIIECNKLKNIVLSDRATIIRFLIFLFFYIVVIMYYFQVSLRIILIVVISGIVIAYYLSRSISRCYKRKLFIPCIEQE